MWETQIYNIEFICLNIRCIAAADSPELIVSERGRHMPFKEHFCACSIILDLYLYIPVPTHSECTQKTQPCYIELICLIILYKGNAYNLNSLQMLLWDASLQCKTCQLSCIVQGSCL